MTEREIIKHVDDGANFYVDFFANAKHMERVDNGFYCYTRPASGEVGIDFVYNVRLEGLPKETQVDKIAEIKRLGAPVWWNLLMSDTLYELVHGVPKETAPSNPSDDDELYMAVLSAEQIPNVPVPTNAFVKKVRNRDDFSEWADLVNGLMWDGHQDIHPENHYHACESGKIRCYICYKDNEPVAHCAVMNNDGICSLEFVATRSYCRRQGLAKFICVEAIRESFENGAHIITLRSINPGTRELYTSLGFKIYNYAL